MKLPKQIIVFLYIILSLSCHNNKSCLNEYFVLLEEYLLNEKPNPKLLYDLKTFESDSLYNLEPLIYGPIKTIRESDKLTTQNKKQIANCLENVNAGFENAVIIIAFNKYLNGKNINIPNINKDINQKYRAARVRSEKRKKLLETKKLELAKRNNLTCKLGDTIDLKFQLEIKKNYKSTYNTYSQNFLLADDTFKVKAIITDKFYMDSINNYDIRNLFFKLKVLDLNYKDVVHMNDTLNNNDDFILPLVSYGINIK